MNAEEIVSRIVVAAGGFNAEAPLVASGFGLALMLMRAEPELMKQLVERDGVHDPCQLHAQIILRSAIPALKEGLDG